jgi:hypothetical protein
MAPHTIRVPIPFHERRIRIKWITTFTAEKMSDMPLRARSHNDFAFNRRLATFATRAEEFVKVKMAEESNVDVGFGWYTLGLEPLLAFVRGFGVEGDTLESGGALVAGEAFGMEHGFEVRAIFGA